MQNWIEIAGVVFAYITLQGGLITGLLKGAAQFSDIAARLAVLESKVEGISPARKRRTVSAKKK